MREKTVEAARMSLVVLGLVLLVVFGVRAAGQARDMKIAGALQSKVQAATSDVLGFLGFKDTAKPAAVAQPVVSQTPAAGPTNTLQVEGDAGAAQKTLPTTAADAAQDAVNKQKANANAQAAQVNGLVNKPVNAVTKTLNDAGSEFTRIWP